MHTPSALLVVAGSLSLALAGGQMGMPARRTLAAEIPVYDAGLSPAPTPDARRGVENAMLNPRALGANTCGYREMDDGSYGTFTCGGTTKCQTRSSYFGCKPTPFTTCFDGTAAECKQTTKTLGPLSRCCTDSNANVLPFCVTYIKDDGGQKTMYQCGSPQNSKRKILFLGTETNDPVITKTVNPSMITTPTSSETSTPPPDNPPSSSSSNTGAIVGGVVGGVAVVAIAVCVVVWLVVRRRRQAGRAGEPPFTPGQQSQYSQPYYQGYSGLQPQGYGGYEEHYKPPTAAPSPVPAPQPVHEVPATPVNGRSNPAELGS